MMTKQSLVIGTALALFAGSAWSQANEGLHQVREPYQATVYNPCTAEYVDFTGHWHRKQWAFEDGSGTLHRHFIWNMQHVEGVGQSTGTHYTRAQNLKSSTQWRQEEDDTLIYVKALHIVRLISHGMESNSWFMSQVDAVYSITSDDPLEEDVRIWIECR